MTILFQSHSGREKEKGPSPLTSFAAPPAGTDIAVDEQADFGYFVPPLDAPENYLPDITSDGCRTRYPRQPHDRRCRRPGRSRALIPQCHRC